MAPIRQNGEGVIIDFKYGPKITMHNTKVGSVVVVIVFVVVSYVLVGGHSYVLPGLLGTKNVNFDRVEAAEAVDQVFKAVTEEKLLQIDKNYTDIELMKQDINSIKVNAAETNGNVKVLQESVDHWTEDIRYIRDGIKELTE